jgi:hypothetical protein
MKKFIVLLIAVLTTFSLATPSSAQAKPEKEPVYRGYGEQVKSVAPKAAKLKTLTTRVVSVGHAAKTLTVMKTGWLRRQEVTFTVQEQAAFHLADLEPGDWVDVTYAEADGKLIAHAIVRSQRRGMEESFEQ